MFLGGVLNHTPLSQNGSLTLENVIVLIGLLLFGEAITIELPDDSEEIALDREGERKLEAQNIALSVSKIKTNSTYSSRLRYFTHGAKAKSYMEFEAMLAYLLSGMFCPVVLKMESILIFPSRHQIS